MIELETELNIEELSVVNIWADKHLEILCSIENSCFILSANGDLEFESCFGEAHNNFEKKQKYFLAVPKKIIKYYQYYLLENKGNEGEWFVGEQFINGNIEFYKCCHSLKDAFESL